MARRALGPATLQVRQAVAAGWQRYRPVGNATRGVLVACSGGPDSLALAAGACLALAALEDPPPLAAVVVDHQLQQGSDLIARQILDHLCALGYSDAVTVAVSPDRQPGRLGPEATARATRYAALEAEADRRGSAVLLGHTLDDQAETVLLGLLRGSGIRSLAGMADQSGRWLRPLLGLRRDTTVQACAELELQPWLDPHNADPAYRRSRLRERVLPVVETELGGGIAEALARTAGLARDDADLLDELAHDLQDRALATDQSLDCAVLAGAARALRTRVIKNWLTGAGAVELTAAHIQSVEALVTDWHGQRAIDVPARRVSRRSGRLTAEPHPDRDWP